MAGVSKRVAVSDGEIAESYAITCLWRLSADGKSRLSGSL